jgi:MFS family permease
VALYFGVPAIIYVLNTPLVPIYCRLWNRRAIVFLGSLIFSIWAFMIGTSRILGFQNDPKLIFFGLCMTSFSSAMVIIPIFPEMLNTIETRNPRMTGDELNNVCAGFFNSCVGIGEAVGPLMASVVSGPLSFRRSEDAIGCMVAIYCIMFLLGAGGLSIFTNCYEGGVENDQDDHFVSAPNSDIPNDFRRLGAYDSSGA